MCVLSIKMPIQKSLETYRIHLVYIMIATKPDVPAAGGKIHKYERLSYGQHIPKTPIKHRIQYKLEILISQRFAPTAVGMHVILRPPEPDTWCQPPNTKDWILILG